MLKHLLVLLVVMALAIFGLLYVTKSADEAGEGGFFSNPFLFSTSSDLTRPLPYYQIPEYKGIEIADTLSNVPGWSTDWRFDERAVRDELLAAEGDYDDLTKMLNEARNFGEPSPYRDQVRITGVTSGILSDGNPAYEYITLEASYGNDASVDITGWSLQNVATSKRPFIPQAVKVPGTGSRATPGSVMLEPGTSAIITTGRSPIGMSFRENSCIGYLGQFQSFLPTLDTFSCPNPADELPVTADNLNAYGEECLSFVSRLPACRFYIDPLPNYLPPQCRDFIQNALTYNGCVARNGWRPSFNGDTWRIYLDQRAELWDQSHNVIRLLDRDGKTVDAWVF